MKTTVFQQIWEFLGTIFSSTFSVSFSSLPGTSTVSVLVYLMMLNRALSFCFVFFINFLFAIHTGQLLLTYLYICRFFILLAKICCCAPLIITILFFVIFNSSLFIITSTSVLIFSLYQTMITLSVELFFSFLIYFFWINSFKFTVFIF